MNIHISKKSKGKASSGLGFGLNDRGATGTKGISQKRKNVFDGSDDDEESDEDAAATADLSGREQVNRQIVAEQDALRKRAQAAAAAVKDSSIYDYDNAYDSFKASTAETDKAAEEKDRKSKYIGDLLKAAKQRERERDVIHERQVARTQAEEDEQADYKGKEKFITKAYKRKLAERQQWEAEEEEQRKKEEENDVSKNTSGTAFGNFYGNFTRNVALGGKADETKSETNTKNDPHVDEPTSHKDDIEEEIGGMGFLDGFERSDRPEEENEKILEGSHQPAIEASSEPTATKGETTNRETDLLSIRDRRRMKVAEARVRYMERRQNALQLSV